MTITRKKRPRDPLQLGKLIVDIATGQVEDKEDDGKDAAAAELGRKGGAARAAKLTSASGPREWWMMQWREPVAQGRAAAGF
jgi:hypothetical protein